MHFLLKKKMMRWIESSKGIPLIEINIYSLVIVIPTKKIGHKAIHCRVYRKYNPINVQRYENNKNNAERRNNKSFSPLQDYNVECYKCNNYGHKASECIFPKYDKKINIPNNKKVWKKTKT